MESNLNPINVGGVQRYVPLLGEIHCRRVGFLVLDETDAHDNFAFVSQEEANGLEPTRVSGPPSRTRDASREAFVAISMRHTSCELQFRVQFPTLLPVNRWRSGIAVVRERGRSS